MLKIKEIREDKGLTVEKLASDTGISVRTIYRWETGATDITGNNLVALADIFGCTTDELLGRENYGTGNVEIIGEKLSRDEEYLINVFRALNADGKNAFLSMVKNLATLNNIAVKIS